jgi:hypothetical protein
MLLFPLGDIPDCALAGLCDFFNSKAIEGTLLATSGATKTREEGESYLVGRRTVNYFLVNN